MLNDKPFAEPNKQVPRRAKIAKEETKNAQEKEIDMYCTRGHQTTRKT